jgi:hypothetical protein
MFLKKELKKMEIELTPEAKEFILKRKDQAVTVKMFMSGG